MQPSNVVKALDLAFRARRPVMLWGEPGIGKSSVVKQAGAKGAGRQEGNKRGVRDIRLALLDPTDLRGIPFYNPETGTAEWALASMLPQDPDSTDIIFLDEINAAPPAIQASAYQLVLDRAIGDYTLPDGVDIVAAGNREQDKAVTYKMPTPLLNRFIHLDFEFNADDWFDWAFGNDLHPAVISFLKWKPAMISKFDPKSADKAFASPRTWEFASDLLKQADDIGSTKSVLRDVVAGAIGSGAAIELLTHRELADKLPDPTLILEGKITEIKDKLEISAYYSLMVALTMRFGGLYKELLNKHSKDEVMKTHIAKENGMADNFLHFVSNNFETEYCVMGVRACMKQLNIPLAKAPAFKKFSDIYGNLIVHS